MPKSAKGRIQFSLQPKGVWESKNPVLPKGAIGFEQSDDGSAVYGKVGNGETAYSGLPYLSCPNSSDTIVITCSTNEPDDDSYWFYIEEVNDE